MSKGTAFIVSGPSGSGKDTLLHELFIRFPEIRFSVSSITREMRPGEKADGKYRFITRKAFEKMLENDELLESNCYIGNYYGTPAAPVHKALSDGADIVIEVDVNGAAQIRKKLPDAVSIFIMPPSFQELKRRLSSRCTESEESIKKRLDAAITEIKRAGEYDYIVINDDIAAAAERLAAVVTANRLTAEKNISLIKEFEETEI